MVSSIHILMLTVSSSAPGSFKGSTNGRVGLSPYFFYMAGGGSGPFLCFIFEPLALLLLLEFIIDIYVRIASDK